MPDPSAVPGLLLYRCRRCEGLDESNPVPDVHYALLYLVHGWPLPESWPPIRPGLHAVHVCSPGFHGVADLIGGRSAGAPAEGMATRTRGTDADG